MSQYLNLTVPGLPIPQGSMRLVQGGRRMIHSNPDLRAWRARVAAHAIAEIVRSERQGHGTWPATGECGLNVTFFFPRPKNHYRTGRFAHLLRDVAPRAMYVGPDLDKLIRAIGDALTDACVVVDDKQIWLIKASKKWTNGDPYAAIELEGQHGPAHVQRLRAHG